MIHYVVMTLLFIGVIFFGIKVWQTYKAGLEKVYQFSGKQVIIQYVLLILLALSIIGRHWDKLQQSY